MGGIAYTGYIGLGLGYRVQRGLLSLKFRAQLECCYFSLLFSFFRVLLIVVVVVVDGGQAAIFVF